MSETQQESLGGVDNVLEVMQSDDLGSLDTEGTDDKENVLNFGNTNNFENKEVMGNSMNGQCPISEVNVENMMDTTSNLLEVVMINNIVEPVVESVNIVNTAHTVNTGANLVDTRKTQSIVNAMNTGTTQNLFNAVNIENVVESIFTNINARNTFETKQNTIDSIIQELPQNTLSENLSVHENAPQLQNHTDILLSNKKEDAPVTSFCSQFVCSQHNKKILVICELPQCKKKRCLCEDCFNQDKHHLISHPMFPAEIFMQYFNSLHPPLKPSSSQKQHHIRQSLKQIVSNSQQAIVEQMKELTCFYNELIQNVNQMNSEQSFSLKNCFKSKTIQSVDQCTDRLLLELDKCVGSQKNQYVVNLTNSLILKNKEVKLKSKYLNEVCIQRTNFQADQEFKSGEKLKKAFKESISSYSERPKNLFKNIPSYKVKVKKYEDFQKLTQNDFCVNSSIYVDLSSFNPVQMKKCLTKIFYLPIPQINFKFASNVGDISLLLNQYCKNLNLNFSNCKVELGGLKNLENSFDVSCYHSSIALEHLQLDFSLNGMQNPHVKILTNALSKIPIESLVVLSINLRLNSIQESGIIQFSQNIRKFKKLHSLKLNFDGFGCLKNQLNQTSFQHLCGTLFLMKNLRTLYLSLSDTSLTSNSLLKLINILPFFHNLKDFDLNISSNPIDQPTLITLFSTFRCFKYLKILSINIDYIQFNSQTIMKIASLLQDLTFLSQISLSIRNLFNTFNIIIDGNDLKKGKESKMSKMIDSWRHDGKAS